MSIYHNLSKCSFVLWLVLIITILNSCSENEEQKTAIKPKAISQHPTTIYIQPFNGFPKERVELVKKELKQFYKINVIVLPYKDIFAPSNLTGTNRYSADKILDLLEVGFNKSKDKILGLTSYDIYSPKEVNGVNNPYWGIFGLGRMDWMSCVVSDFRLVKFTGKTNDFVVNTVLHEIGHTFNLDHCDKDERCLMNDAKELRRIKELEEENSKLKRMYANLALDLETAKWIIEKKL